MSADIRGPIRFGHFSTGLQVVLILILVGSCAGGSSDTVNNDADVNNDAVVSSDVQSLRQDIQNLDVQSLRQDIQNLEQQVRALRAADRR